MREYLKKNEFNDGDANLKWEMKRIRKQKTFYILSC